jgi:hypothetical protein
MRSMADPVLVILGGAVVKTAVRLWVGPNVLADNLTANLTDLLEGRVSDARERRKLRRRFEEMEDIVADQVFSALEVEFRGLNEGERNAAVEAVTETFNRARVTGRPDRQGPNSRVAWTGNQDSGSGLQVQRGREAGVDGQSFANTARGAVE